MCRDLGITFLSSGCNYNKKISMLRNYNLCTRDTAFQLPLHAGPNIHKRKYQKKWKMEAPEAAIIHNFHLPMERFEVKNRLMHELVVGGKNATSNSKLMPLIEWLFCEPNPTSLNTTLAQLGVVRSVFQLPYIHLLLSRRVEFVQIAKDLGWGNYVGEKNVQILDDD